MVYVISLGGVSMRSKSIFIIILKHCLSLIHYVDIHIDGAEAVVGKTAPTLTQIKAVAMCF